MTVRLTGTVANARMVCEAWSMKRYVVHPSVRPFLSHSPAAARAREAGLLLWARRVGDIDRLLQQRRAADECEQFHVVSVRMDLAKRLVVWVICLHIELVNCGQAPKRIGLIFCTV